MNQKLIKVKPNDTDGLDIPVESIADKKLKRKILQVFDETCKESDLFLGMENSLEYITLRPELSPPLNYLISSQAFADRLVYEFYEKIGIAASPGNFAYHINSLAALTRVIGDAKFIYHRLASENGAIYYNLLNQTHDFVKITKDKVEIINYKKMSENGPKMVDTSVMLPQVLPNLNTTCDFVATFHKYLNLETPEDEILLIVSVISWLWTDQPRIILVLQGPAGSAKSWTTGMIKALIDGSKTKARVIPNNVRDMSIDMSSKYFCDYDNLSGNAISSELSDLLCQACYGGSLTLRKLRTDGETYNIAFANAILLNGITSIIAKPDLLDRAIIIHTKPIAKTKRKKQKDLEKAFKVDLPELLGAMFQIASQTLAELPNVHLTELTRMADYQTLGAAISKVIWGDQKVFLDALAASQANSIDDLIFDNDLARTIKVFADRMKKDIIEITPAVFYKHLQKIAEENGNLSSMQFPKNESRLMKEIAQLTGALSAIGLSIERVKSNGVRYAKISRKIQEQSAAPTTKTSKINITEEKS